MRRQFNSTLHDLMKHDERIVLLLAGVGVYSFRGIFGAFPKRVYDLGISEAAAVGMAAGLAKEGMIPVVYTIAPFLIERAYEQIKLDIALQGCKVILTGVGGSYDYSREGPTHHCPADVPILYNIPGMNILIPGTADEVDLLLRQAVADDKPYYMRLSERVNAQSYAREIGKAAVVQDEAGSTLVIAVGPALQKVIDALEYTRARGVKLLYLTSVRPLDAEAIRHSPRRCVMVVEPYYSTLPLEIDRLVPRGAQVVDLSVPREFIRDYGNIEHLDQMLGFTAEDIAGVIDRHFWGANHE